MSLYGIGTEIQVEMINSEVHIGRIYSYDEESKLLVIFKGSEVVRDFMCLNVMFIKHISTTQSEPRAMDFEVQEIDLEKYIRKVEKKIEKEMKIENLNKRVTQKVQKIFNEFSKTYQCEWDSLNILITNLGVVIRPPYVPSSVEGPEGPRNRISTILAKIREKLEIE